MRRLLFLLAAIGTIGCDQVTKQVAVRTLAGTPGHSFFADVVRFVYAENAGGFLSLGANLPGPVRMAVLTVATGIVLVALIALALAGRWRGWQLAGLTLFVAGGVSNWIDRLVDGTVVDFLNVGIGPVRTGVFNVADIAIMCGAAIFLLGEIRWLGRTHGGAS
jgi:signal peptidase II